jgi:hypothetical protein
MRHLLSLKTDVNVPAQSNKNKIYIKKFVCILKVNDEKSRIRFRNLVYGSKDPYPDPYQNVTDSEHC